MVDFIWAMVAIIGIITAGITITSVANASAKLKMINAQERVFDPLKEGNDDSEDDSARS